jgi:hypothetical protein
MLRIHLRFTLVAFIAGCGGYENAVPFQHDATAPDAAPAVVADAALIPDAPDDLAPADAAPAADLAADTTPPDDAQAAETAASCGACYAEALASATGGACKVAKANGCDEIPAEGVGPNKSANDRVLCQALDDCMKTTKCWAGANGPSDCFCGTASKLDCTTPKADGVCKAQIMAATKAANELLAGAMLFSPNLPSGFAAQKYACYWMSCLASCK